MLVGGRGGEGGLRGLGPPERRAGLACGVQGRVCDGAAALILEELEGGEGGYLVLAGRGRRGRFGREGGARGAAVWRVGPPLVRVGGRGGHEGARASNRGGGGPGAGSQRGTPRRGSETSSDRPPARVAAALDNHVLQNSSRRSNPVTLPDSTPDSNHFPLACPVSLPLSRPPRC